MKDLSGDNLRTLSRCTCNKFCPQNFGFCENGISVHRIVNLVKRYRDAMNKVFLSCPVVVKTASACQKSLFFISAAEYSRTETVRPSWRSKSFSQSAKVTELSARHVGVTIGFKRLLSPHHYIPLKYIIVSFSPIDVFEIFRKQTRK